MESFQTHTLMSVARQNDAFLPHHHRGEGRAPWFGGLKGRIMGYTGRRGERLRRRGTPECYTCLLATFVQTLSFAQSQDVPTLSVCNNTQVLVPTTQCVCDGGFFLNVTECTLCPIGTYKNTTGDAATCTLCTYGMYSAFLGQVTCRPCPQGQICHHLGCLQCHPCAYATTPNKNMLICVPDDNDEESCDNSHQRRIARVDRIADYETFSQGPIYGHSNVL